MGSTNSPSVLFDKVAHPKKKKHFTRTSDIPRLMANALRVHECQLWVNDNRGNPNTILGAARANAQQMLWHLWGEAPNDRTKPDTKTHPGLMRLKSNPKIEHPSYKHSLHLTDYIVM
jgi:hypothetical protein